MARKNELKDKISEYLTNTWEELQSDIESLPEKDRAMAKLKLLDYAIPKVQATKGDDNKSSSSAAALLAEECS